MFGIEQGEKCNLRKKQIPATSSMYSADDVMQSASPIGENENDIENQQLVKSN